jgi:hypothetical protein
MVPCVCVTLTMNSWLADAVTPIAPTSGAELEEAVQQLDAKKLAWVDLQDADKAKLLRRCIASTVAVRHPTESRHDRYEPVCILHNPQ